MVGVSTSKFVFGPNFVEKRAATKNKYYSQKRLFQIGWIIINAVWLFSARLRPNIELGCKHGCRGYCVCSSVLWDVCGS